MLNQEDLNKEMADIGVGRFNAQWESANKYKDLSRSKAGQKLIRDLLEEYSLRIEDAIKVKGGRPVRWKEDIRNYNVNKVAFIALKTVLNGVSEKITMTRSDLSTQANSLVGEAPDDRKADVGEGLPL